MFRSLVHPFQQVFEVVEPALPKPRHLARPVDQRGQCAELCAVVRLSAFVAVEHERRGLKPRDEAPREVLLRRVYLDLVGLPPTPEELRAFLAEQSPDAYEKLVDRLLNDPRHGERWGRHWMDVWRYSDWYGSASEIRNSQQYIWHWRDWIIDSLNQDKGYDRMILEMFAADELAPTDSKNLAATGYLARNWFRFNRNVTLQDLCALDLSEHVAIGLLDLIAFHEVANALDRAHAKPTTCASVFE